MPLITFKASSQKLPGGMAVESQSRGFKLLADEPKSMRGTDEGMSPVEMLLCSLGSCMTIVATFFAREAAVVLEDLRVELEGDLDTAGFMGKETARPGLQEIRYKLFIKSPSPPENVDRLMEIMKSRCPVGDSLSNGVKLTPVGIEVESQS